jgi:hypothetical protein
VKYVPILLIALLGSASLAQAQGNPSGPGAVTGDPAKNSASSNASPTGQRSDTRANPSGSGTSPSGGKDDNPDHGFSSIPTDHDPHGRRGK